MLLNLKRSLKVMNNKNRVLILSGGSISIAFLKEYLENNSFKYIIAADYGLVTAHKLKLKVDYILGDFDSVPEDIINYYRNKQKEDESLIIKEYDPRKDYTDTQIAIEVALKLKADEIILIGATGTRLDHTLSNVQNLVLAYKDKIKCSIIDEYNKLYIIRESTKIFKEKLFGPYISLLPLTPIVEKVTLKGFKYILKNEDMALGNSIGVSNQVIEEVAEINFDSGALIVVESRDKPNNFSN